MNDPYFQENPWSAPTAKPPSPYDNFGPAERPQVVVWFYVYCGVMTCIYLLVVLFGIVMMVLAPGNAKPEEIVTLQIMGGAYLVFGLIFGGLFGAAPFLPKRPWVWIYDIVIICLGLTGCPTLFACIPLLIFWLKPETKRYFGRPAQ